jgi:hypothetical protein
MAQSAKLKNKKGAGTVVGAYIPSYFKGRGPKNCGLRPAQAKKSS